MHFVQNQIEYVQTLCSARLSLEITVFGQDEALAAKSVLQRLSLETNFSNIYNWSCVHRPNISVRYSPVDL